MFAIVRFLNTIVLWLDDEPSVASGRDSDGDGDGMIRVEGVSTDFSLFLSDGSTVRQAGVIEGQGDGTRYTSLSGLKSIARPRVFSCGLTCKNPSQSRASGLRR